MSPKLTAQDRLELVRRALSGESVVKICRQAGISRVIFYRWLKRYRRVGELGLTVRHAGQPKKATSATTVKPKRKYPRLSSRARLQMIEGVTIQGRRPAEVAKTYGVSRVTLYKWLKRYNQAPQEAKEAAVVEKQPQIVRYWRQTLQKHEQAVLSLVAQHPEYGIRKLLTALPQVGGVSIIGHHGVQNILRRYSLSTSELRLAYAQAQVTPVVRTIGYVLAGVYQFFTLPPTSRAKIIQTCGLAALSAFVTIVVVGLGGYVFRTMTPVPGSSPVGLVFASLALFMGSVFFLYSLKYYITLAIVLSFSQKEGMQTDGPETKQGHLLSWLLGGKNGHGNGNNNAGDRSLPVGLEPDLDYVSLKSHPMVSVHIPFYNEKNVVQRGIEAAVNFDYPQYEIILADDSSDETSLLIAEYQKQCGELMVKKGDGWTLTQVQVKPGVTLKHLHRTSRKGFKGGALQRALEQTDRQAEFVVVLDADFVPYPDTLELFLKYFKVRNKMSEEYKSSQVAAVQGYQWHVLNKSENWITRGVRSEYAGSYVIERSGAEIYSGLKQISGSVYMIRKDVLAKIGWGTSITEDFELTLKLYEAGYKVVYTPYIQAPAECVSTIKRLIRQRMRWAEGHSNNIKKMFMRLITNPKLTGAEKMEFLYLAPYYLQAFFFMVGTIAWLLSETVWPARLPFWTSLWGWSLILTNFISLPLMNAVGLFLEESEERDYSGLLSFVALSYILVPFQAYASLKGFLQKEEGPWFRTPKTGKITNIFTRGRFYRLIAGILPGRSAAISPIKANDSLAFARSPYLGLATANSRFDSFTLKPKRMRWMGKLMLVFVLTLSLLVHSMAINPTQVEATWYDTGYLYHKKLTIDNTLVSGSANHSNFPVLVSYSDADLRTTADGGKVENTNGYDIVFTDDDKTTKFDHEIEDYTSNATTGTIVMWVRFPTLPYNVDKDFYIYYGNSSISTSQENVTGVWDTNFKGVWHLKEDPTPASSPNGCDGGTKEVCDSTSANNGDSSGAMTTSDQVAGQVNGSLEFDGATAGDDYINVVDSASLDITDAITFELWVNPDGIDISRERWAADKQNAYFLDAARSFSSRGHFYLYIAGAWRNVATGADLTAGSWNYLVGTYDSVEKIMRIYLAGGESNTKTLSGLASYTINASTSDFKIGQRFSPSIDGKLDEVRLSNIKRSADWIATEYNNQANQGTGAGKFIKTLGTEEQVPEFIVLLLPLAILIPYFVKYTERRKKMYLGIRG